MVAAICIVGICIYFYFWTKRVRSEQDQEWSNFGVIEESEQLAGIVSTVFTDKKKLYHQYWYIEQQIVLYDDKDYQKLKVILQKPSSAAATIPELQQKDAIICYGKRKGQHFYANRIIKK